MPRPVGGELYLIVGPTVWISKTKSLLSSLYEREGFPLFGRQPIGPLARRAKRG